MQRHQPFYLFKSIRSWFVQLYLWTLVCQLRSPSIPWSLQPFMHLQSLSLLSFCCCTSNLSCWQATHHGLLSRQRLVEAPSQETSSKSSHRPPSCLQNVRPWLGSLSNGLPSTPYRFRLLPWTSALLIIFYYLVSRTNSWRPGTLQPWR